MAGKQSPHLHQSGRSRQASGGVDEVVHRFRLDKIYLAVEQGAQGELPGAGKAGFQQEIFQHPRHNLRISVAGYFHAILPGVAGGRAENGAKHLIQRKAPAVVKTAQY